jgi:hypothetical protein
LVGKPVGKRKIGRQRPSWMDDNINMILEKISRGGMDLMYVAQDRDQWRALVNKLMNLRVP